MTSNNETEEDIPGDFFDDFNKEEFMEGLNVIDSWDDNGEQRRSQRFDMDTVEHVTDLRELLNEGRHKNDRQGSDSSRDKQRKKSRSEVDEFIKPGSRRDPNKTTEAIKRDKELKVKQYLAKSIYDDTKPPGTELDDFYNDKGEIIKKSKQSKKNEDNPSSRVRSKSRERLRRRISPRRSPVRRLRPNARYSPDRRYSPHRYSPGRRNNPHHYSPRHQSPSRRHSPRHQSPARYSRRSRSPIRKRSGYMHSPDRRSPAYRHRSPEHWKSSERHSKDHYHSPGGHEKTISTANDSFLYPTDPVSSTDPSNNPLWSVQGQYPGSGPGYGFGTPVPLPGPAYALGFGAPYEYVAQPIPGMAVAPHPYVGPPEQPMPVPTPVPAPVATVSPSIVPAPQLISPSYGLPKPAPVEDNVKPYDALAQLVAEGKISKEDYLKLAPNKGLTAPHPQEMKEKEELLSRCNHVLTKIGMLHLPNRLIMHNNMALPEPKAITTKFCSPLKRQLHADFHFSRINNVAAKQQHNKQVIDSLVASIGMGLEKVIVKPNKKQASNMKDASCQTTRPYCDVCDIRENTKYSEASTSVDHEFISKPVYTQVDEKDLFNSKAVFTPGGGIADGAPMSISNLTPAQLLSQLAAKAKTLKQTNESSSDQAQYPVPDQSQYSRRNPPHRYNDYSDWGENHQGNYRY